MGPAEEVLIDHYKCPEGFIQIAAQGDLSEQTGFFRFGPESVCYGRCSAFTPSTNPEIVLNDALGYVRSGESGIMLPFDLAEAVSSLRYERYVQNGNGASWHKLFSRFVRAGYYTMRPLMGVSVRKHLQRYSLRDRSRRVFPHWPVDTSVETIIERVMTLNLLAQGAQEMPFIWFWPDGAQACAVMTHDVETAAGRDFCSQLMDMDDSYGVKASFQVVPECRYEVPKSYIRDIQECGFEVNVHDLNHDGALFRNYEEFRRRAALINKHGKAFGARGFRAAVLYRNIDWLNLLDFDYDMSVPNVAHLDPQYGGCCTTFPYFIGKMIEIPVTMTQDYSLFNILRSYNLDLWELQMAKIREKHGVMNFIVHPDYILEEREQCVFRNLLNRLRELRETAGLWIALPRDVSRWWRMRSRMELLRRGNGWEIAGEGYEHARIAYACLENGKLAYKF